MYVNEYHDNHVEVDYVSAHTNHELGAKEMPYLPLPSSVKEEVAEKWILEYLLKGYYKV